MRLSGILVLMGFACAIAARSADAQTSARSETSAEAQSDLQVTITRHGNGRQPVAGNVVIAHYIGTLADGSVFDSSRIRGKPFAFTLGHHQVIAGWDRAFSALRIGDVAVLVISPALAYGDKQIGNIPPNSTLRFEVELLDIKDAALADVLEDAIGKHGAAAGLNLFNTLRTQGQTGLYASEGQLNGLGYRYLKMDDAEKAVMVFRLNAEMYPDSANVYDSLGEGYVAAGRIDEAISAYRHSVELDPANANARSMLKKLLAKRR